MHLTLTGNLTLIAALSVTSTIAAAATSPNNTPQVPSEPPYIVLSDNLDEPNGYGFCIDTYGRGKSELVQTHSCKPKAPEGSPRDYQDNDARFEYDEAANRIRSYAFEGLCLQALLATGKTEFGLLKCSDTKHQSFVYSEEDQTIRLLENAQLCLSVATETQEAGPWVKRPLELSDCASVDMSLAQWTVVLN